MTQDNLNPGIEKKTNIIDNILEVLTKTPVAFALITVLVIIVYGQTVNFGFTYLDDKVIIVENINSQAKVFNLKEAFTRDAFFSRDGLAFYRPLQNVSFMIDAVFNGKNAGGFHLTNLIFHILTCFSVFFLFKILKYDKKAALLVALIYAVHPIFTHAVAWVPSRGDLMIAFFGIVSFIGFVKFVETGGYQFLALNILSFILAVFSKETAVLFPMVYAGYYLVVMKKKKLNPYLILLIAVYIATILAFMVARSKVIITNPGDNSFSINSFITNIPTLPEIIAKFILPVSLSTMPKFTALVTSIGTILMVGIAILLIMKKNKKTGGLILFGIGWWLLFAVPAMAYRHNYADFGYEYFEHRSYLPMIGVFIILIEIYKSFKPKIKTEYLLAAFATLIIFFSGYSFINAKNYNTIFTFFGRAITTDPKNALANYNMGNYLKEKQKPLQAKKYFTTAIRINPNYLEAYQNLADVENFLGNRDEAIKLLKTALNVNAYYYTAWKFLGVLYGAKNLHQDAIFSLWNAYRLRQNDHELYNAMGASYMNLNKKDSAVIMFKKALEIRPDYRDAAANLLEVYKNSADTTKSREIIASSTKSFEKQKAKNPKDIENYITLGELYGRQGLFDKSIEALKKAIEIDPTNDRAYNNMGTAYAVQKKFSLAAEMFSKAVQNNPNNTSYLMNLGLSYMDLKQKNKAIEPIRKAAKLGFLPAKNWLETNKVSM